MQQILSPIQDELKSLEEKLISYLVTPNPPTNQVIEHIFQSGGKRLRPALFLLFAKLIGYTEEHLFPIAAVCEYIHTASLLHDDVIDNSTLRRNKPTTNSIWGDETAVLAGDLIYSAACRLMVRTKSLELIDGFAECIRFMSESELYQLELLWKHSTTKEQYEKLVLGKTACLFESCTRSPGYLKNLPQNITTLLGNYGKHLGLAFQIIDDCLDYEAQEAEFGKPVQSDLLEGKMTLPLIYALQKNEKEFSILVHKIIEIGSATTAEMRSVSQFVSQSGALQEAKETAAHHCLLAQEALNELKQKHLSHCDENAYRALLNLLHSMTQRKF